VPANGHRARTTVGKAYNPESTGARAPNSRVQPGDCIQPRGLLSRAFGRARIPSTALAFRQAPRTRFRRDAERFYPNARVGWRRLRRIIV
jgi:hypothetical protein